MSKSYGGVKMLTPTEAMAASALELDRIGATPASPESLTFTGKPIKRRGSRKNGKCVGGSHRTSEPTSGTKKNGGN